ncbi:hypothetical protein M885DRAFT_564368 [Pelagophyceae sp. CCMP2097]|nr:hypothetical protein M885DRAFT_564368 [Pelagophyceae sp. CCMP2097]
MARDRCEAPRGRRDGRGRSSALSAPLFLFFHAAAAAAEPVVLRATDAGRTTAMGWSATLTTLVYAYEIPTDHAPGTHWYHDHTHGGSAMRIMGGLHGALIVKPLGTEGLPAAFDDAVVVVISSMQAAQILDGDGYYSFTELSAAVGSELDGMVTTTATGDAPIYLVNGAIAPSIEIKENTPTMRIDLTGACTSCVVAFDGVHLDAPLSLDTIYLRLLAGGRADLQVLCSGAGTMKISGVDVLSITTSASATSESLTTAAEMVLITRPLYLTDLTDATVDITYSNHVSQGNRSISTCGGADLSWWGGGTDCSAVNEWSLYGLGRAKHPLHLHVHHMHWQVIAYECVPGSADCLDSETELYLRIGQWRDVLPTIEGNLKLTVRFRVRDFPGETVLHCHFLRHEDLGMMDTILVKKGYRPGSMPEPTAAPTPEPTAAPTPLPGSPTAAPTAAPTPAPGSSTPEPMAAPTAAPTPTPTPVIISSAGAAALSKGLDALCLGVWAALLS